MTSGPAYRPGRELARGGMGAVLDAHDPKFGRSVAMKVMLRRHATPEEQQRFLQEARVLGRLAHPNIVPVHDLGTDAQGRHFYTMKLVQGVTLHDLLHKLKAGDKETLAEYPLNALLTIFQKVCDAVAFAHAQGIIHRDLKPQNIMVGEFGEVLVMDWGLAKFLPGSPAGAASGPVPNAGPADTLVLTPPAPAPGLRDADTPTLASAPDPDATLADSVAASGPLVFSSAQDTPVTQLSGTQLTLDGTVMGTPNYMSPEQAAGRVADLDERADVYSLGAVLYALLTLHPPVEGKDVNELLQQVLRGDIVPPTRATEGKPLPHLPDGRVPDALSAVAMKALTLNRDARYRSASELARDIAAYQGGFATAAEQAGTLTQLRLFIARHRVLSAAAAVIVLLTALFITRLSHERDVAQTNEALAKRNEDKAVAESQRAATAEKAAKDNEQKATKSAEAQRRESAKTRTLLADAAFRTADLAGMTAALEACPEDLRDQTWDYLWAKRDASLGDLKVPGFNPPAAILALPGRPARFLLTAFSGHLAIVDAASGAPLRTVATAVRDARVAACSGDGKVLAAARPGGAEVHLLRLPDGAPLKTIALGRAGLNQLALNHDGSLLTALAHAANGPGELSLVDTATGTARWQRREYLTHALFHPDGDRLLIIGMGQQRQVLILGLDNQVRARVEVYPLCQALSPDGRMLAVGTHQGEALLIHSATGVVVRQARLHTGSVHAIAWTGDGHLLTMGSEGKFGDRRWVFRLWEAEFLSPRATFFGLKQGQYHSQWTLHPESGDLLTLESPPRRWSIPVGRELVKLTHASEQAWGGVFVNEHVIVARKSFELTRYDLGQRGRATELPGGPLRNVTLAAAHWPSGQFAVASKIHGPPYELRVCTGAAAEVNEKLRVPLTGQVNDLAFDAAGMRVAVVLRDGTLEVFSTSDGKSRFRKTGNRERAVFGGTNLFALTGGDRDGRREHRIERLDPDTGSGGATIMAPFQVNALAVSPDGQLLAAAAGDRYVYFTDTAPGPNGKIQQRQFFRVHDGEVGAVAFHPTQPILATASADGSLKLWDHRAPKQPLATFLGLGGTPVALSFNPSGKLLLVDGQERTTRVYDVAHVTVPGQEPPASSKPLDGK
jgi:serine/threonine protein kinase/WD40 repeat protein